MVIGDGLTGERPIEGRFSGVVDVPNSCVTLDLPAAIFDSGIGPSTAGPQRAGRGRHATT